MKRITSRSRPRDRCCAERRKGAVCLWGAAAGASRSWLGGECVLLVLTQAYTWVDLKTTHSNIIRCEDLCIANTPCTTCTLYLLQAKRCDESDTTDTSGSRGKQPSHRTPQPPLHFERSLNAAPARASSMHLHIGTHPPHLVLRSAQNARRSRRPWVAVELQSSASASRA